MLFDADDLDWAMGELLELFERAGRNGVYPHALDPALFHSAWSVLNAQPFETRDRCQKSVMTAWGQGSAMRKRFGIGKRYENALAH